MLITVFPLAFSFLLKSYTIKINFTNYTCRTTQEPKPRALGFCKE